VAGIIVTGGAGFIGCNLVRALNERGRADILIVDEPLTGPRQRNLEGLRFADFAEKDPFRAGVLGGKISAPEVVFHLGACSRTTESDAAFLMDNNCLYSRQLCEWSLRKGARFIAASSAATYGDGRMGYSDRDETTLRLRPMNAYGRSKHAFDVWALQGGLFDRIVALKYFNVFGPRESHKGDMCSVVLKAFREIGETGRVRLFRSHKPEYADGEQDRDFVYVKDAVDVTLWFQEHPGVSGLFNCGTGRARTWNDLARAVFDAMGLPPRIEYVEMPEGLRGQYQYHTRAEMEKLRRAGYAREFHSLEEGVRDYVRGYLMGG